MKHFNWIMFLIFLLICTALRAFNAQAKVVTTFKGCEEFFYNNKEPQRMDQNAKKICQMMENKPVFFATLYSTTDKIPLYSAYKFDPQCSQKEDEKPKSCSKWHIEPQLTIPSESNQMIPESKAKVFVKKHKVNQALSSDYMYTGFDRGHLNPNGLQCADDARKATFTLTNAAPMDACFNRIHWKNWEGYLHAFLKETFKNDKEATAYIITGTVPGNKKIPQEGDCEDTVEQDTVEQDTVERVTVPSHIWTAVCYKHHKDNKKSFSFGYLGENKPEFSIELMSVSDMNQKLSELHSKYSSVKIFDGDCFSGQQSSKGAEDNFLKLIKLPEYQNPRKRARSDSDATSAKKQN